MKKIGNENKEKLKDKYQTLDVKTEKIECEIREIGEIRLELIKDSTDFRYIVWKKIIEEYHYIGHGHLYGGQIRYLIRSERYGLIGALGFSSSAWKLKDRENWIGWNEENRLIHLKQVICNSRFLILPHVKVPNLASHILSISIREVKKDWLKRYGIEPVLIETFVEQERFRGICYQSANFQHIGETQGRGRQDRDNIKPLSKKDIYMYPLQANFRTILCAGQEFEKPEEKISADWVEVEFCKAKLGDIRLNNRLYKILRDFYANPQANIPQACQSRAKAKAVYRFLDNEEISMEKILRPHYQSTISRIQEEDIILAVQDTMSLNYSMHPATENLGPIGSSKEIIGLMVHDTLAFNVEGTPLGLLDVQCWARNSKEFGKRYNRDKLSIEKKESKKWLESFKASIVAQKESARTSIVSVGDREADIYELFEMALSSDKNPKLLVRAVQNRILTNEQGHLWEYMENIPVSGIQKIKVPRKKNQPGREAELVIRFAEVELKPPKRKGWEKDIKVWSILAQEENAPEMVQPLKWMLLTTIPINTFEEATEKLRWYAIRWCIEIYHKTLKSGCKIETRQLGNADRIEKCLAIDLVIAWRIYYLTKLGREVPDVPCTVFFEEAEWKALVAYKTKNPIAPSEPPSLRDAVRMVASIGGFLGRKSDGDPGTKTIWLGLQALSDITEMWRIFNNGNIYDSLSPPK